jgi:hypothetical protein
MTGKRLAVGVGHQEEWLLNHLIENGAMLMGKVPTDRVQKALRIS